MGRWGLGRERSTTRHPKTEVRYVVRLCSPRAMVVGHQIEGFHAKRSLAQENGKTRGNKKKGRPLRLSLGGTPGAGGRAQAAALKLLLVREGKKIGMSMRGTFP